MPINSAMMSAVLEICAGGGGQALGLEMAGFELAGAVEIDSQACATLRANRPNWAVLEKSVAEVDGRDFSGIAVIAGGVPCPPFSIAGKQLGPADERNLFPEALRLVAEARPAAVMLENVPGFASARFSDYRAGLLRHLRRLGYATEWRVLNACCFGVPQLRPRFVAIAAVPRVMDRFAWPDERETRVTVGNAVGDLMGENGWKGVRGWVRRANGIAPTLVGGSKKHGGPDLGPTRARKQWAALGVDGLGIADAPPGPGFPCDGLPRLTLRMAARVQGFPDDWSFSGGKTAGYRQIGNALPPPVAHAVGAALLAALTGRGTPARTRQAQLFTAGAPA